MEPNRSAHALCVPSGAGLGRKAATSDPSAVSLSTPAGRSPIAWIANRWWSFCCTGKDPSQKGRTIAGHGDEGESLNRACEAFSGCVEAELFKEMEFFESVRHPKRLAKRNGGR
jgi:hypothetical protein